MRFVCFVGLGCVSVDFGVLDFFSFPLTCLPVHTHVKLPEGCLGKQLISLS